jgi:hypothetical protein
MRGKLNYRLGRDIRCLEARARELDVVADDADWAGAARAIRRVAADMRARARAEGRFEPAF